MRQNPIAGVASRLSPGKSSLPPTPWNVNLRDTSFSITCRSRLAKKSEVNSCCFGRTSIVAARKVIPFLFQRDFVYFPIWTGRQASFKGKQRGIREMSKLPEEPMRPWGCVLLFPQKSKIIDCSFQGCIYVWNARACSPHEVFPGPRFILTEKAGPFLLPPLGTIFHHTQDHWLGPI